ncbi:MAG: hypothetical protein RLZ04_562 [Actinomycetota bacterium]|jgi:hypothetical protein
MDRLTYTEDELMAEHEGLTPHVVAGRRMHGGFHPDGTYQPPRALWREPALREWEAALVARGGAPMTADSSLLGGVRLPNVDQSRVLLRHGLGETFWNTLTITGKIEAKGRLLAQVEFPELQPFIVDDISGMGIGHLNKGLLRAHGYDEGGIDGVGAHDEMWFVARDLAFGEGAYPDVEPPENIARPEVGQRFMPEVDMAVEGLLSLLMNLLVIEFRAEIGFTATQAILRTSDLFADRRAEAEEAAMIVERIRTDELIHVSSLRLFLGECESVTFRTVDGGTIAGSELIQRFWGGLVRWATVDQPRLVAEQQHTVLHARVMQHSDGPSIWSEFESAA